VTPNDEEQILFGAFVLVCVFLLLAVIGRMF
jgi:hypothetical protein